ncbi:MAG: CvpA family protein [Chlamydiota bacterium]
MHLDIAVVALLRGCFGAGMLRGFQRQCVARAALSAGLAAGWLAIRLLARALPGEGAAAAFLSPALCALVFAAVYCCAWRVGMAHLNRRAAVFARGAGDRILGGAFSLAKGLASALVAVWLLDALLGARLTERPRAAELWRGSRAVRFACRHNGLSPLKPVRRLKGFLAAFRDPDARKPLHDQSAYAALVSNPRYRAVRDDKDLRDFLARKQWGRLISDPNVCGLAADRAFRRTFFAVRWEAAAGEGAPSPRRTPPPASLSTPAPPAPALIPAGASPAHCRVVLKNGSTLRGRIAAESPGRIMVEVPRQGGVMVMEIDAAEVSRIEPAGDR